MGDTNGFVMAVIYYGLKRLPKQNTQNKNGKLRYREREKETNQIWFGHRDRIIKKMNLK